MMWGMGVGSIYVLILAALVVAACLGITWLAIRDQTASDEKLERAMTLGRKQRSRLGRAVVDVRLLATMAQDVPSMMEQPEVQAIIERWKINAAPTSVTGAWPAPPADTEVKAAEPATVKPAAEPVKPVIEMAFFTMAEDRKGRPLVVASPPPYDDMAQLSAWFDTPLPSRPVAEPVVELEPVDPDAGWRRITR